MKDTLIALVVVDFLIMIVLYFFAETGWLVNSQVAFISSSIVMLSSMKSYKNMVDGRLNVGSIPDDERDTLDKLEDPYDLYDDENKVEEEKSLVEVVKEERANLKKSRRSVWDTTKDAKPSFSFYRLAAYAILIFGFFYLNTNQLLLIMPYLIFLSIPSIIIVIMLMKSVDENR